jgi:hypothetical protein
MTRGGLTFYASRKTQDARSRKMAVWLLFLSLAVMTAGCGTACRCCRSNTASIASAPERVEIDGREYTMTANAWRDFQPVAPPDGQPLIVVVRVAAADGMLVPADISVDRVWVLDGKKQWSAAPEPAPREPGATRIETAVRGGPKWGPGIKVDVVAWLKQGKKTWLVRAAGVDIKRTD